MRSLEASVIFVSPKEISKLNKKYRGLNKPTDVLSFPLWTKKEINRLVNSQGVEEDAIIIGDIVIAEDVALEKAKSGWYANHITGKPTRRKVLEFLVSHGILHLLGYHHR